MTDNYGSTQSFADPATDCSSGKTLQISSSNAGIARVVFATVPAELDTLPREFLPPVFSSRRSDLKPAINQEPSIIFVQQSGHLPNSRTASPVSKKTSNLPTLLLTSLVILLPACYKLEAQSHEVSISEVSHGESQPGDSQHGEQDHSGGETHHVEHKITVTSPVCKDMVSTQQYVCQIHSCRHIEVRALEGGYLEKILVREGQAVNQGDLIFKILPVLYQAKLDSDVAEAQLAQIELQNTQRLFQQSIVAQPEVALAQAKLSKALANVNLARAELAFADIKAPFAGIVDKQFQQLGSLIEEGDILTTLSDNSVMWVYFNVPEARYLEYTEEPKENLKVELVLANHKKFPTVGTIGAIEADFNHENGNIAFRADFPNPDRLLRHGQTGTVWLSHVAKGALVIPQRAKFEILAKTYVFVVDDDDVVHQREIVIEKEMDDIYLIKEGLAPTDKIILEGIRQVRDGQTVDYEFRDPAEVLSQLKYHAE